MLRQSVTSCCIFSIRCRFMRRSRIFTAHWTSLNLFQIYSCRGSNETCIKHNLKNTLCRMAKKRYGTEATTPPLSPSTSLFTPPTHLSFFCFQTEHCHQIGTHGRADHLVTMVTGIECHLWVHACTFSYTYESEQIHPVLGEDTKVEDKVVCCPLRHLVGNALVFSRLASVVVMWLMDTWGLQHPHLCNRHPISVHNSN